MNARRLATALGVILLTIAGGAATRTFAAHRVNIAISNSTADFAILLAIKRGYFAEEGIDANGVVFDSGGKMMAPLGSGEIDVATGSANATLYNAVARGISLRVVSGNGNAAPGYGHQILIVRKQLVDSGRFKTMSDIKGMKVALPGPGTGATSTINEGLKKAGLGFKDIEPVYLAYPNHVTAIANGAIDAAFATEPSATYAVRQGFAVRVGSSDQFYPWSDATHIIYSSIFIDKKPDVGRRFMRAFMKAMRFYDGALADGGLRGPNADAVIDVLTEFTDLKDRTIYKVMSTQGANPDAKLNLDSLKTDFFFFKEQGWIEGDISDPMRAVDTSIADKARAELGPYLRK